LRRLENILRKRRASTRMTCSRTCTTNGWNPHEVSYASNSRVFYPTLQNCSGPLAIPAGILHATRLVALDPLRESYYQSLMRLHLLNHDRSSALRVYHQCMRTLQRELGVSPGKSMQEMLRETLKSEELPAAPVELPPYAATKPIAMVGRRIEPRREAF
jgi:hypothetical protein